MNRMSAGRRRPCKSNAQTDGPPCHRLPALQPSHSGSDQHPIVEWVDPEEPGCHTFIKIPVSLSQLFVDESDQKRCGAAQRSSPTTRQWRRWWWHFTKLLIRSYCSAIFFSLRRFLSRWRTAFTRLFILKVKRFRNWPTPYNCSPGMIVLQYNAYAYFWVCFKEFLMLNVALSGDFLIIFNISFYFLGCVYYVHNSHNKWMNE